jgi:hypothetical protein
LGRRLRLPLIPVVAAIALLRRALTSIPAALAAASIAPFTVGAALVETTRAHITTAASGSLQTRISQGASPTRELHKDVLAPGKRPRL